MATPSLPSLPCVVGGSIEAGSTIPGRIYEGPVTSSINGFPYEFTVTINVSAITNLDQGGSGGTQFDATNITVGQWVLINNGCAYLIVAIDTVVNVNTIIVTLRDVDMYNALSDPSQQGGNFPSENNPLLIFSLSDNGVPMLTYSTTLGLIGTWLNDALGRFAYRNLIETYYNFDINNATVDYSAYSVGQIVYIGQSNDSPYCFLPIDPTNPLHIAKAFGTVSSVNQPELSNIHVRPYGKLISTLPFTLPGDPGDVLYYNASNAPSYCTNIAPATNAIPQYIKISSNVASVLYGSIGGGGGGGGGNTVYNDSWIQSNIIAAPPAITFGTIQATSTNIYIPWTYPAQAAAGAIGWVPLIKSISSSLTYTKAGPTTTTVIPFQLQTGNTFINYNDGSSSYITGVVLSQQAGSSRVQTISFPGEVSPRQAYVYYNVDLYNMISGSNIFSAWYENNSPTRNIGYTELTLFISAGPPSEVQNLAVTTGATTASISFTAPASNDITDAATQLVINNYIISYSNLGSAVRYGGPIQDTIHTIQNGTSLSSSVSGLFPDDTYTFLVAARNSGGQIGASNFVTVTTSNLSPIPTLSNISFPDRYYSHGTIKNVETGAVATRLINATSDWTSRGFAAPIHSATVRASQDGIIMSLAASLSNDTVVTGPGIDFDGFPADVPAPVTLQSMTLTPISVTDTYASSVLAQQGFYLQSSNTITIESANLVPSSQNYTLSVRNAVDDSVSSADFTFQCDTLLETAPTINNISFSLISNEHAVISGVNVVYGTPTYQIVTGVGNMGNYYYSSPVITYVPDNLTVTPSAEVDFTNSDAAGQTSLPSTVEFDSYVTYSDVSSLFTYDTQIEVYAHNPYGSTGAEGNYIASQDVLTDGRSYTLIYVTLPQTLPSLVASTPALGFRISSGLTDGVVPPFTVNSATYASTAYDNSADITNLQDLLVTGGRFTTPTGITNCYADFTPYYYTGVLKNTLNYVPIREETGYRYASFAWRITQGNLYGSSLQFTIQGITNISISGGIASAGSSPIRLFYRFEDAASAVPTNLASFSSAWINGNSTTGIQMTSGNYFNPANYLSTPNWALNSVTLNGTTLTFDVGLYPMNITTQTMNLYCRIGLPMTEAVVFTTVTARLS